MSRSRKKHPAKSCPRGRRGCGVCAGLYADRARNKDERRDAGRIQAIEDAPTVRWPEDHRAEALQDAFDTQGFEYERVEHRLIEGSLW